jgi:HD superfamily phosphodiesterase
MKYIEFSESEDYLFHTLQHTRETVKAVLLIGKNSGLSEKELEIVTLAALFHDYVRSHYDKGRIKNLAIINKKLTKFKKNVL